MGLSNQQIQHFERHGYLKNLRLLTENEVSMAQDMYDRIKGCLPKGADISHLAQWDKVNNEVFALASKESILSIVRSLLGEDFYLWDAYFFVKKPYQDIVSQWHQDMYIWPMEWGKSVTVTLAISDCTRKNGCLRILPETHLTKNILHRDRVLGKDDEKFLFVQEIPEESLDLEKVTYFELAAGEGALHHEWLVHGSGPNTTGEEKVSLAFRYSSSEVGCNQDNWPNFSVLQVSGVDRFHKNKVSQPPLSFGVPTEKDLPHYRGHLLEQLQAARL